MPKFERLKWIPMIVKAYNDARTQTEQQIRMVPTIDSQPDNHLPSSAHKKNKSNHGKASTHHPAKRMPQQHQPATIQPRSASPGRPGRISQPQPVLFQYRQMLQELRQTKAKLGRLENIHKRLTESQAEIQSQLSMLLQQIDNGVNNPAQKEADSPQ